MTEAQNRYKIVPFGRNGKIGEIVNYDTVKALEIARALETASEVNTIQIYFNNYKIHEWKRPPFPHDAFTPR